MLRSASIAASSLAMILTWQSPSFADEGRGVNFPTDAGVIDVTRAPYHAKGDGVSDDTAALQRAIDDHTGKRHVIYLPAGTYLVSGTLRWPEKDRNGQQVWGFTHVQGRGRDRTILKLKDGTFRDPSQPQPVMTSGRHGSADWFHNYVCDLTIDTGRGNAGAIGLQFFSNNVGAVRSVAITSTDGGGVTGLDLAYNDMNGPLLVKGLSVHGFAVGVRTGHSVNSQTFEHVELRGQRECGLRNDGQCVSLRDLRSTNAVPAVENGGGLMVLLDSTLRGADGSGRHAAVTNKAGLHARNVRTEGYRVAVENQAGHRRGAEGPAVREFTSNAPVSLFPSPGRALGLPIRETPEVPWDDPTTWANVARYGADPAGGKDSSAAIQAAIDSGATTVYFPTGSYALSRPILIRKAVRRVVGFNSVVDYEGEIKPAFRVVDGEAPVVVVENFFPLGSGIRHESARTLVVRDCELRGYEGTGRGDLFVEDVVAGPWSFDRQNVWARQFNAENKGTHVSNRGGRFWVLGLKTERGGTLVETSAGGRTQIDGGFSYTTEAGKLAPMFVSRHSDLSATFAEVCFNGDPYGEIVSETRGGETRLLDAGDARWGGVFILFDGHEGD